jgi:hypothetical protein
VKEKAGLLLLFLLHIYVNISVFRKEEMKEMVTGCKRHPSWVLLHTKYRTPSSFVQVVVFDALTYHNPKEFMRAQRFLIKPT